MFRVHPFSCAAQLKPPHILTTTPERRAFDLNYAGVFRLTNIPQENVGPLLMIECPRLLFPFARELIASAISNGGFPPLMLQPIDFVALYQRRLADMQAQPSAQA